MDSAARIVACFLAAARDIGVAAPATGVIRNYIGIGMREAVAGMFPATTQEQHQQLIERYRHYDGGAESTPSRLFEGVVDMLEGLDRRGYYLAVATSKGRRGLDRVLAETGLEGLFHTTRCADEAYSKPHPQMLLDILERVGVDPHEAVMVGDTEYDLFMARNAAVDAIGVACGVHERHRLENCAPVACLERTPDLMHWLNRAVGAAKNRNVL